MRKVLFVYILFFISVAYAQQQTPEAATQYNFPLFFDSFADGIKILPITFDYDLSIDNGRELKVGNIVINKQSFSFEWNVAGLTVRWPAGLVSSGKLEILSQSGLKISEFKIKPESIQKNSEAIEQLNISNIGPISSRLLKQKDFFRFCLTYNLSKNHVRLCSSYYGLRKDPSGFVMGKIKLFEKSPRVLVDNKEATIKGSVVISENQTLSFFAQMRGGEIYEFVSTPEPVFFYDVIEESPNNIRMVGFGARPLQKHEILNPDKVEGLTRIIGFESTITDTRKFWETFLHREEPFLYFVSPTGGVFKYEFQFLDVPQNEDRLFLHKNTSKNTYIDGASLYGIKPLGSEIVSDENSIEVDADNPQLFKWKFKSIHRGEINKSHAQIQVRGKKYKVFYEMYKGFPREISLRLSGVASNVQTLFFGEFAYNQWFEDLWGWRSSLWSKHRWGTSIKYFQALSGMKLSEDTEPVNFNALYLDLKYRMPAGIWGYDEAVGPIFSYHRLGFDQVNASLLGMGVFWARSMPKVFDDLFNFIPFLRYPKWVDMELVYYGAALDSTIQMGTNYSLNFHGKIWWTDAFFGEAGFGLRKYDLTESTTANTVNLGVFFATIGMGLNF